MVSRIEMSPFLTDYAQTNIDVQIKNTQANTVIMLFILLIDKISNDSKLQIIQYEWISNNYFLLLEAE